MAGEEEWMEKHWDMEGDGHLHGRKPRIPEPVRMGGDTSAVKKKHDWNPMADKSEWKTPSMESQGKGDGHQYGRKPRTPEPIPIARKLT